MKINEVRIDPEAIDVKVTYGPNHYEQTLQVPVADPPASGGVTPEVVAEAGEVVSRLLEDDPTIPANPTELPTRSHRAG
jgi:hypothetical protein